MTEEETSRLFEKFMQASPFTHCVCFNSPARAVAD